MSRRRAALAVLLVVALGGSLPGCAQEAEKGGRQVKTPAVAVIEVEKRGPIHIEFFPADAPKTVENFVKLAGDGFYDNQRFHRVEAWVVQAGDPLSKTAPVDDERLGSGGPGYTIKAEFNKRKHDRGIVGMARTSDPDSAGSQFYILLKPAYHLDGQYTVFGRVTKGMEVVDALQRGDRITSVKIE